MIDDQTVFPTALTAGNGNHAALIFCLQHRGGGLLLPYQLP